MRILEKDLRIGVPATVGISFSPRLELQRGRD